MSALESTSSDMFDKYVDPNAYEPVGCYNRPDHVVSVKITENAADNVRDNEGFYVPSALPWAISSDSAPLCKVTPTQVGSSTLRLSTNHSRVSGDPTPHPTGTQAPSTIYHPSHDPSRHDGNYPLSGPHSYHQHTPGIGDGQFYRNSQQPWPIYNITAENVYLQQGHYPQVTVPNGTIPSPPITPAFYRPLHLPLFDSNLLPPAPSPLPLPFGSPSTASRRPSGTAYSGLSVAPEYKLPVTQHRTSQLRVKLNKSYMGQAGQPYTRLDLSRKPTELDLAADLQDHFHVVETENAGLFHGPTYQCKWGHCSNRFDREMFGEGTVGGLAFQEAISEHIATHIGPLTKKQKGKWPELEAESNLKEGPRSGFKCHWGAARSRKRREMPEKTAIDTSSITSMDSGR